MAEGLVLYEQRTLPRRELIYYLKVVNRQTGREVARLGDVHAEGMLLFSPRPLTPGTVYEAALELPKALQAGGRREVPLDCEIVWTRPGPKASTYHENGARFTRIEPSQRATIDQLIELFAMPSR